MDSLDNIEYADPVPYWTDDRVTREEDVPLLVDCPAEVLELEVRRGWHRSVGRKQVRKSQVVFRSFPTSDDEPCSRGSGLPRLFSYRQLHLQHLPSSLGSSQLSVPSNASSHSSPTKQLSSDASPTRTRTSTRAQDGGGTSWKWIGSWTGRGPSWRDCWASLDGRELTAA